MSVILIVDDAPGGREALAKWLQREGFQTMTARNGAEGLVRLKEMKPDMILLDHMMPEVDGLTFLSGMRRFPKWKSIPVIMLTGLKDSQTRTKAHGLNVSEFLVKNEYTPQDLLAHIRKHIDGPKLPETMTPSAPMVK